VFVVDAHRSPSTPGLSFRRLKAGPEQDLLDWFLERDLVRVPRGHNVTVFREPRLPSGFPDLVIVIWKDSVARQWNSGRAALTPSDLRLMHFLGNEGSKSTEQLRVFFSAAVERQLERLAEAAMVRSVYGCWQARSLNATFAASHIIAVEAKISEWRAALDQAHLNTWFASESCVLVPRVPRDSGLLREAGELGVRVLAKESDCWDIQDRSRSKPRSYVSWLFNDWAWRAAFAQ
jgi:hypothetical protein